MGALRNKENGYINSQLADIAINIETFGAIGDDSFDNTSAFTQAIAKLSSIGGGVIRVPVGVFRTDTPEIPNGISITIEGTVSGEHTTTTSPTNKRSVIKHNYFATGYVIEYNSSEYRGNLKIKDIDIIANVNSDGGINISNVEANVELNNVGIAVVANNVSANGLVLYDSWRIALNNVYIRHMAVELPHSTGIGLYVYNELNQGAINQLVVNNIHVRRFEKNIFIGGTSSLESRLINSILFIGGACEHARETGIYIGNGVETIRFIGMHIENTGTESQSTTAANFRVVGYCSHVSYTDGKIYNKIYPDGNPNVKDFDVNGDYDFFTLDNVYSNNASNFLDAQLTGTGKNFINVSNITLSPYEDGAGYGFNFSTTATDRIKLENINYNNNGNDFLNNIVNDINVSRYLTRKNKRSFTTTSVLTAGNNGETISNKGATATVSISLYSPNDGDKLTFIKEADYNFIINPNGNKVNNLLSSITANDNTSAGRYNILILEAIGGEWVIVSQKGTWAR